MKIRVLLFSYVALLINSTVAFTQDLRRIDHHHLEMKKAVSTLRVATINCWSGLDNIGIWSFGEYETTERREQRYWLLVSEIRAQQPDVVFLQEANPVPEVSKRLARELGYDAIHQVCNAGIKFGPWGIPTNLREGIAILAKPSLKLKHVDSWKLGGSPGIHGDLITVHFTQAVFALVGTLSIDSSVMYLVNVHLFSSVPSNSALVSTLLNQVGIQDREQRDEMLDRVLRDAERRQAQTEELMKQISLLPPENPILLGGDFNAVSDAQEMRPLRERGIFTDTHKKSDNQLTWDPTHNPNINYSMLIVSARGDSIDLYDRIEAFYDRTPRKIDHIFVSRHFRDVDILSTGIFADSPPDSIYSSDHYGVVATIDVSNVLKHSPKRDDHLRSYDDSNFEVFPILSYDTDTGFGFGGKAFALNQFGANESVDLTLFGSSKGERWLRFVFSLPDFERRQGKIYPLALDLNIDYDKWLQYNFFGIGLDSRFTDRIIYEREVADISFTLSKGFTSRIVAQAGLRYKRITNSGLAGMVPLSLGLSNSFLPDQAEFLSVPASLRYDSRDSFINPSTGLVVLGEVEPGVRLDSVNTSSFARYGLTLQYYMVVWYPRTVMAARISYQSLNHKRLPFQGLLSVGGSSTVRWAMQERYLIRSYWLTNWELRFPLIGRLGGLVGFDAVDTMINPVVGLRFYMDTFVVRADIGFGSESTGFYLNFGHMF